MRIERTDGVAVLRLEGGKANAIGAAFLDGLQRVFAEFEASNAPAAVLTGYDIFFSAGLNLPELLPLERDAMRAFIARFHAVMSHVFACPRPVVAAINGHAVAGGCVLAMQADHRVMADGPFKIGLNEAQLGLGLPPLVAGTMRLHAMPSAWNDLLLRGRLASPRQAHEFGVVDKVVTADRLLASAVKTALRLAETPAASYAQIKAELQHPTVVDYERDTAARHERWLDTWFNAETRFRIQAAVERLTPRKS